MERQMRHSLLFTLFLIAAPAAWNGGAEGADAWPQFRGPKQDGHSDAASLPLEWSEQKNIKWKTEIPGEGWSSPIVGGGQVWLTTAVDDGRSLHALCIDEKTGAVVWDVEVFKNAAPPPKHRRNSYASPTGVIENGKVYVHFGPMGTACLDAASGSVRWENRELVYDSQNGPGGSLTMWKDKLLVACDGTDIQFEAALDKATGKVAWKSERSAKGELLKLPGDNRKAYGTSTLMRLDGRVQSLTTASNRLYALDPDTGTELWHFDYPKGFSNVPLPVTDGKTILVSSGFMKPVMYAIKASGLKGNVTATHTLWKQAGGAPNQSSPLIVGERVYLVTDGGILTCLRMGDGSIAWKERIATDFAASPTFAAGRIYLPSANGPCIVIAPGDVYKKLAENSLDAGCMASPAISGKAIFLRTKTHLYRVEE
jgi:outer membrane protein assembly factor BamB